LDGSAKAAAVDVRKLAAFAEHRRIPASETDARSGAITIAGIAVLSLNCRSNSGYGAMFQKAERVTAGPQGI
jgi:hypothetical protein